MSVVGGGCWWVVVVVVDGVEEAEDGLEDEGDVWLMERGDRGDWKARDDGDFTATTPDLGESMLAALGDGELRVDMEGLGEAGICGSVHHSALRSVGQTKPL